MRRNPLRAGGDGGVIVIRNDRGGLVAKRAEQIRQIRRSGQRVEIRGGTVCLSSCTMYLGLPGTCISPNTTFAFTGRRAMAAAWHRMSSTTGRR